MKHPTPTDPSSPPVPGDSDFGPADAAYDALADLFLGSKAPAPHAAPPRGGKHITPPAPEDTTAPAFIPRLVGSDEGDAPFFRGDEPMAAKPRASIECLIMGHLPVLASAWAAQYARSVAEALAASNGEPRRCIGFVQLRGGHLTVDLVGTPPAHLAGINHAVEPEQGLERALRAAGPAIARWIVRVDETEEPELACDPSVDTATLLTSADEAAVVGAYRVLKGCVPGSGEIADRLPQLRVAVMGAEPAAARVAFDKLAHAARTFLSREVEPAAVGATQIGAARIGGSRTGVTLVSGRSELCPRDLIALLRAAARVPAETAAASAMPSAAHAAEPTPHPVPPTPPPPAPASAAPAASLPRAASRIGTSSQTEPPPAQTPLALCEHVRGLRALPAHCPYAERVELAVDETGRLHAMLHDPTPDASESDVEALMVVSSWAAAHASLLRCLVPNLDISTERQPVLHLFVDQPKALRRLLDTPVRLHLLASVEVDGVRRWVCRELN